MTQQFHFWVYNQGNGKHQFEKICISMFTAAFYFPKPRYRNNLCPGIDGWIKNMWHMWCAHMRAHAHTHTRTHTHNGILFSRKKGNLATCNNTDKPWGHYAKWNKSEKDKYHYERTYMCNLKKKSHWYRKQIGGWGLGWWVEWKGSKDINFQL